MKDIWIVLERDFREMRRTNAFRVLIVVSAILSLGAAIGISVVLSRQAWLSDESARPLLDLIIGVVAYFLPLFILMAFIWAFASLPIVREKVNGNIDSLLATPLSPRAIWMAKGLAVFLPGIVFSIIATLLVVVVVNLAAIIPATGSFVLPAPVVVTCLIINPLLFFGLLSFIVLFSLANNPDIAIAPSFILGFGLMIGMPLGLATGAIDPASWAFTLWYFAGTAAAWIIVVFLSRLLTKENIVLSSKGE